MLSRLLKTPNGALSSARLALVAGVAVFVVLVTALQVLERLGADPSALSVALLVAAATAVFVGGGLYGLIRAPLRRADEARLANIATRAVQNERITTDSLTGLLNRQGITASLLEAMAHAERYGNPLSVALVAVDNLTRVQQESGRKAGDKLVRSVADIFAEALRLPDRVGRYDEGEFLVVLPQAALKDTGTIAERIRASVSAKEFSLGGKRLSATISIGVGRFRKGEDLERLLSRVSEGLGKACAAGGNRVVSAK